MTIALVKLDKATQMLAEIRTVDDAKQLINLAEAARVYARQVDLGLEAQNHAAEIKLRAQRRGGEVLKEMEKAKGTVLDGRNLDGDFRRLEAPSAEEEIPTYAEMGIEYHAAHNWQTIANMPEKEFEIHITETLAEGKELTTAATMRIAKRLLQKEEAQATEANVLEFECETKYHAIVIDPPWPVRKILRDVRPNQDVFDYPTMTIEEIANLPIGDMADPNGCHIYLWVTHKFLPDGLQLFEQWGVKYQCIMTWVKNVGFTPFSWMYSTEHVLFGRIGSLPLLQQGLRLDFRGKVQKHSRKPDEFYQRVIEASPNPRIDLFAREPRDGFEAWGNEINGI